MNIFWIWFNSISRPLSPLHSYLSKKPFFITKWLARNLFFLQLQSLVKLFWYQFYSLTEGTNRSSSGYYLCKYVAGFRDLLAGKFLIRIECSSCGYEITFNSFQRINLHSPIEKLNKNVIYFNFGVEISRTK